MLLGEPGRVGMVGVAAMATMVTQPLLPFGLTVLEWAPISSNNKQPATGGSEFNGSSTAVWWGPGLVSSVALCDTVKMTHWGIISQNFGSLIWREGDCRPSGPPARVQVVYQD